MKGIAVPPAKCGKPSTSLKSRHALNTWHNAGHGPRHTNFNHPSEDLTAIHYLLIQFDHQYLQAIFPETAHK